MIVIQHQSNIQMIVMCFCALWKVQTTSCKLQCTEENSHPPIDCRHFSFAGSSNFLFARKLVHFQLKRFARKYFMFRGNFEHELIDAKTSRENIAASKQLRIASQNKNESR